MENRPAFAGFAHGGRGINDGAVEGFVFMPNCHASISQAKAELCAIIDSTNSISMHTSFFTRFICGDTVQKAMESGCR